MHNLEMHFEKASVTNLEKSLLILDGAKLREIPRDKSVARFKGRA
jgi:hypothetical protein